MTKRPSYTQLKAKKNWKLHTSSSQQKFKTKSRLKTPNSRRRSTSVRSEHRNLTRNSALFHSISHLKGLFNSDSETEETPKVFDVDQNSKWPVFGLGEIVNIPVNMALGAFMNGAHYVRHCFQETRKTIGFCGETLNCGIRNSFQSVESYQRKFVQMTSGVIFPSLSYKRKFEELNERIGDLEREVKKLKTCQSESLCSLCQHSQEDSATKPQTSGEEFKVPPPPPPPPPPVAPPPPPLSTLLKTKKSNIKSQDLTKREEKKSLVVSIEDIKSVKLRKVSSTNVSPKHGDKLSLSRQALKEVQVNSNKKDLGLSKNRIPVITMKDLMAVKLKRKTNEAQQVKSSLKRTPENNIMVLRRNLRKVNQKYSPGGTPLNKTIQESGDGLTPLITRALKKKFELANPCSASPEESSTSPIRKRRALSLSPVQATPSSWSTSPALSMR